MTKVMVMGGAGYIGSHTCKALANAGFVPVTFDNMATGAKESVKWGPLEIGDIADRERLDDAIAIHQPSAVFHFAAHIKVGESVENPGKYYRNNVASTLTMLDAVRTAGIQHVVFSSSAAVYAAPTQERVSEDHTIGPNNPYGHTKYMVEQILEDYGRAYNFKWIALRYFNAAGADPDGEIGLMDPEAASLVPAVLRAALSSGSYLQILGTDYDTPDGTGVRDFVHVTDLAMAHVLALQYLQHGGETGAINLGAEKGFSVRQVIETARRILQTDIPIVERPRRAGDLAVMIADSSRAQNRLNWKPIHSSLEEIISTAAAWEQFRKANGTAAGR